jgi:hypothetical protein
VSGDGAVGDEPSSQLKELSCKHQFHSTCLKGWTTLEKNRLITPTCPMCRCPIESYEISTPPSQNQAAPRLSALMLSVSRQNNTVVPFMVWEINNSRILVRGDGGGPSVGSRTSLSLTGEGRAFIDDASTSPGSAILRRVSTQQRSVPVASRGSFFQRFGRQVRNFFSRSVHPIRA